MSELGPDYLRVMREALCRFYEEIRSFHADHGNDLAPGSPALKERVASPHPESLVTAWSMTTLLIEFGAQHVSAFVKTITAPVEPIASLTCVRSLLESCALASWLLDPSLDARTRVRRVFAIRYEEMEQSRKYVQAAGGNNNHLKVIQELRDRVVKVEQDAQNLGYSRVVDRKGKRIGIGEKMPSATEVINLMLDEESHYRLLSAVAHGHNWAIRELSFSPVPNGQRRPDIGGVPVTMFEKTVDVEKLAVFGLTVAKAFAKPVWYKCNYAGWDQKRLIGVLESIFDELRAQSSCRFWRPPKG